MNGPYAQTLSGETVTVEYRDAAGVVLDSNLPCTEDGDTGYYTPDDAPPEGWALAIFRAADGVVLGSIEAGAASTPAPTAVEIADAVLTRSTDPTDGQTAERHSLGALVRIGTNSAGLGTTVTAKKADGTPWATFTTTNDSDAEPTTGIS